MSGQLIAGGGVYFRPTRAAAETLPVDKQAGWWQDADDPAQAIPRNRQDQRIRVDGVSYRIREMFNEHRTEYLDAYREADAVFRVDVDPDPSAPAYRAELPEPGRLRGGR